MDPKVMKAVAVLAALEPHLAKIDQMADHVAKEHGGLSIDNGSTTVVSIAFLSQLNQCAKVLSEHVKNDPSFNEVDHAEDVDMQKAGLRAALKDITTDQANSLWPFSIHNRNLTHHLLADVLGSIFTSEEQAN